MASFHSWAAHGPKQKLVPYEFDPGPIGVEEVEVAVEHCGLCHSDLSLLNNDWGRSQYPLVPGHEVIGRVVAVGEQAKGVKIGDHVGIGWTAGSCMHCALCLSGNQHLCRSAQRTIIGHAGGFADRVRAHWAWTIPLPSTLDATTAPSPTTVSTRWTSGPSSACAPITHAPWSMTPGSITTSGSISTSTSM